VTISPEGEILVRGNTLFAGYVAGVAVDRPLTPDGWFVTGDLGKWDPQGRLIVLGRKDSMFTSGGENVYPEEIERYLCQAPGVVQAVVVPLEDAEFGSRPVAFVKVASPAEWDPPAFAATLRQFLPRF
jgi:O-succinylbenzoic acid--CoA ligase